MEYSTDIHYQTQSPVLFLVFNRPELTQRVFNAIKASKPKVLYIAADGPRADREDEYLACMKVRDITSQIDWPCQVKTLFRELNLGCKEAVSSAIDWFFGEVEEGIILEDDCLPSPSFFSYCDTLLEKYRYDERIRHIGGANLQFGKKWGASSYYFSNLTHVWGWASWRRVWATYDKNLIRYQAAQVRYQLSNIFTDPFILDSWEWIYNKLKAGEIDTWDYQLTFTNFFNNSLSIIPNKNLISNIGFQSDATHTFDAGSPYANLPLKELEELKHPLFILPEKNADFATLSFDFNLEARYKKHNKWNRRLKRYLKKQRP
jgi:hypothetical protein